MIQTLSIQVKFLKIKNKVLTIKSKIMGAIFKKERRFDKRAWQINQGEVR